MISQLSLFVVVVAVFTTAAVLLIKEFRR